jgi:hypothetical protein
MDIMDALRTATADEIALGDTAAAMLEDNATPYMDIPMAERGEPMPAAQGRAEQGSTAQREEPEPLTTDFDGAPAQQDPHPTLGQRIEHAIMAAASRDTLDVAADEIRELASPDERAKLEALYRDRCQMVS